MQTTAHDGLTPEVRAYLSELAADIVANGGPTDDPVADIQAAHERRREFIAEMLAGRTDRSQMAVKVMAARVYGAAAARAAAESAIEHCAHIADSTFRRRLYS